LLNEYPAPRRVLVQWVPHGYGWRALNLPFAFWIATRALAGDRVELLVHEPYIDMSARPLFLVAALVQRAMLMTAAASATRIWVSTPSWMPAVRPYLLRRQAIEWLPVPASVLPVEDTDGVHDLRERIAGDRRPLVGHFGSYSPLVTDRLQPAVLQILRETDARMLLVGDGSDRFRASALEAAPALADRLTATGALEARALSTHLQACDVMVQPYPDGISARRTTAVALLAHGLPVVTNHGRLTEEFWRESGAVDLVDSSAPRAFTARVGHLVGDPGRRDRLGDAARDLHHRVFAVHHAVARLTNSELYTGAQAPSAHSSASSAVSQPRS
jgi:glycosyltransferase involved in cell wall biosynthesis